MMRPGEMLRRLKYVFLRDRMTADLEEEMRLHIDMRAAQLGELPDESARELASRKFGNSVELVERSRDEWGARWLDTLLQDWRHALRSLRYSLSLTCVVVATLALVIGANTTIFGMLHGLFLQRLALPNAQNLAVVNTLKDGRADDINLYELEQLRRAHGVPQLEAYWVMAATVESGTAREDVAVDMMTGGFLDMLGVRPVLGRVLNPEDDQQRSPVAVISESFWVRHFHSDRSVLGKAVRVNGRDAMIVGVLPESFHSIHFARDFNIAMPASALAFSAQPVDGYKLAVHLVTSLPASERKAAEAALTATYRICCSSGASASFDRPSAAVVPSKNVPIPPDMPYGLQRARSSNRQPHAELEGASRGVTWNVDFRGTYRTVLLGVSAGVFILLLIACANIATLLLARAVTREREFAVQMSMGASRQRIIRQLVAESLALALSGCILGFFAARVATTVLIRNLPAGASQLSGVLQFHPSIALIGWTAFIGALCTLMFGVWPALHGGRTDILTPLKGTKARVETGGVVTLDRALVVAQIALALVLVCAGSILVASLRNLARYGGESASSVLLIRLDATGTRYESLGDTRLGSDVIDAALGAPGVVRAAVAYHAPLVNDGTRQIRPRDPVYETQRERGRVSPRLNPVSADFFRAAGIQLKSGRAFQRSDAGNAPLVAVVSNSFAHRYFGNRDPVGTTIDMGYDAPLNFTIVGVVADAAYEDPRAEDLGVFYVPLDQTAAVGITENTRLTAVVRTDGSASQASVAVRSAIESATPGVRVLGVTTIASRLDSLLARERLAAVLATLFGAMSVLLVAVGVYGLLSHNTAQRTQEIGVRMALGAGRFDAIWLVMGQTVGLVGAGTVIGLPLAFAFGQLVRSQLFGVNAADPFLMGGGAVLLLGVATLASVIPSARAARVSPIVALRSD